MKTLLALILIVLFLSSCVTERGAMKYYMKHDGQLAELCAAKFPVTEKVLPGKPVVTQNTILMPGPSIPCPPVVNPGTGEVTTPTVKCPDQKYIEKKVTVTDTVYRQDNAALAVMHRKYLNTAESLSETNGKLKAAEEDRNQLAKDLSKCTWFLRGLGLLLVGLIIAYIKK